MKIEIYQQGDDYILKVDDATMTFEKIMEIAKDSNRVKITFRNGEMIEVKWGQDDSYGTIIGPSSKILKGKARASKILSRRKRN